MFYCRVLPGKALRLNNIIVHTLASNKDWLHGMAYPCSGDPVFKRQMKACGLEGESKENFDSIEVLPTRTRSDRNQIHREFVVSDEDQIYPEFVVHYRTDTVEEQEKMKREKVASRLLMNKLGSSTDATYTLKNITLLLTLLLKRDDGQLIERFKEAVDDTQKLVGILSEVKQPSLCRLEPISS